MQTEKGHRRKKIPPTPAFESQVTRCQAKVILSSPLAGIDLMVAPASINYHHGLQNL